MPKPHLTRLRVTLAIGVSSFLVAALASIVPAAATPSAPSTITGSAEQIVAAGSVTLRDLHVSKGSTAPARTHELAPDAELNKSATGTGSTLPPPSPATTRIANNPVLAGFEGLSHLDQRLSGGGNQFSLEPPDQGLCVGGGNTGPTYVVESVNDALNVYDTHSNQYLLGPVTLSQFYGLAPTVNRTTLKYGPFITDPKCYFDADTQRWFHTAAVLGRNSTTGAFQAPVYTALAVSKTSDPLGAYWLYRINAADTGHPNCGPCFGDQPLIGADKHGFYVSTAEYELGPTFAAHFNGPQLYAMSKRGLENGSPGVLLHFANLTTQSGTLQPATSPNGDYETGHGGTEYLESGRDTLLPDGRLRPGQVNEITVWALTNTQSLASSHPAVRLTRHDLKTEVYGQPVPMTQKAGPRPLGNSAAVNEPLPKLSANDERMNQVVFASGHLFSGVNTIVRPGPRTGIAWFVVRPFVGSSGVGASVTKQGYISAADKANVGYPSIGVDRQGQGVVAMTLTGPTYFPSAAYSLISLQGVTGPINIARAGNRPEDGFTCYKVFGGNGVCRWGDYSASVTGPNGRIWSATEYISGSARTVNANWSTFIWPVQR